MFGFWGCLKAGGSLPVGSLCLQKCGAGVQLGRGAGAELLSGGAGLELNKRPKIVSWGFEVARL